MTPPEVPLVLTPGDPRGVGPEVTVLALRDWNGPPVAVLGDVEVVGAAARQLHAPLGANVTLVAPPPGPEPVEVRALLAATSGCLAGRYRALVTGPIHKGRLARAGFAWKGHTELLGELCGVARPVMAFVGGRVRVALVTVHVPLRDVPARLDAEGILHTIRAADHALQHDLRLPRRRVAVCGLNPHAGDDGALGDEELTVIGPAVAAARAAGVDALGPMSAEAAFLHGVKGDVDLIVAMYHDQGLAPLKALDFGRTVNWTLGLPFVRTSVDHGTADDLVGTGRADPSSMRAALELAVALTARREA